MDMNCFRFFLIKIYNVIVVYIINLYVFIYSDRVDLIFFNLNLNIFVFYYMIIIEIQNFIIFLDVVESVFEYFYLQIIIRIFCNKMYLLL